MAVPPYIGTHVQKFLGLVLYNCNFTIESSHISAPLTDWLKNEEQIIYIEIEEMAAKSPVDRLTSFPMFAPLYFNKHRFLKTAACDTTVRLRSPTRWITPKSI